MKMLNITLLKPFCTILFRIDIQFNALKYEGILEFVLLPIQKIRIDKSLVGDHQFWLEKTVSDIQILLSDTPHQHISTIIGTYV